MYTMWIHWKFVRENFKNKDILMMFLINPMNKIPENLKYFITLMQISKSNISYIDQAILHHGSANITRNVTERKWTV